MSKKLMELLTEGVDEISPVGKEKIKVLFESAVDEAASLKAGVEVDRIVALVEEQHSELEAKTRKVLAEAVTEWQAEQSIKIDEATAPLKDALHESIGMVEASHEAMTSLEEQVAELKESLLVAVDILESNGYQAKGADLQGLSEQENNLTEAQLESLLHMVETEGVEYDVALARLVEAADKDPEDEKDEDSADPKETKDSKDDADVDTKEKEKTPPANESTKATITPKQLSLQEQSILLITGQNRRRKV